MNYFEEESEWGRQVEKWLGTNVTLLGVSKISCDIRAYQTDLKVAKIRRFTPASVFNRPNSLEDEYLILCWLGKEKVRRHLLIPRPIRYLREGPWEMLEMVAIATPATVDPVVNVQSETVADLVELARAVWRLNRVGVSHGDLVRSNAGRTPNGAVSLIDFDQAVVGPRLGCSLRDFLGIPLGGRASQFSVLDRFLGLRGIRGCVGLLSRIRMRMGRSHKGVYDDPLGITKRCAIMGNARFIRMAEAWEIAATAGANSPGARTAYYALDVGGIHFPGERPWIMRWEMIRRVVDFRTKRFVELGCNMGLLAIHAAQAGACKVTGADANRQVLDAARILCDVLGGEVDFKKIDFDHDENWESTLGTGDIVSALSLTYWLRDKERLWRYISGFSEVIFEGHEPSIEIEDRFSAMGFMSVARMGVSERNRTVYLARKSSVPSSSS